MSETNTTPEAEDAVEQQASASQDSQTVAEELENSTAEESDEKVAAPETNWEERYLRLYAEFDNYRKRTNRERMDLVATAGRGVIESLLPVVDDFERGLKVETDDVKVIREGQQLVYTKLIQILESKGLKSMDVKQGDDFDTDRCEALTNIPHPDLKGKVVDVIEQGYQLHDTVVRFAKVVVGA